MYNTDTITKSYFLNEYKKISKTKVNLNYLAILRKILKSRKYRLYYVDTIFSQRAKDLVINDGYNDTSLDYNTNLKYLKLKALVGLHLNKEFLEYVEKELDIISQTVSNWEYWSLNFLLTSKLRLVIRTAKLNKNYKLIHKYTELTKKYYDLVKNKTYKYEKRQFLYFFTYDYCINVNEIRDCNNIIDTINAKGGIYESLFL